MFRTQVLLSPDEIMQAKNLLYQVYVDELHWQIPFDNPSGLIVLYQDGLKYLHDKYDDVSTWFGVYDDDRLVACIRTIRRDQGSFELENYHQLPQFLQRDDCVVETNRLAILPAYRGTNVIYLLSAFAVEYEYSRGIKYSFTTAPLPGIGYFYIRKLGYQRIKNHSFRYNPTDKDTVSLMYLDATEPKHIQHIINRMKSACSL